MPRYTEKPFDAKIWDFFGAWAALGSYALFLGICDKRSIQEIYEKNSENSEGF